MCCEHILRTILNLQQIPSRGPLSKYIKRLFIAAPKKIMIKVDYSAHEVRGWSIISGEKGVADVFQQGADLRNRYRLVPDPYINYRIDKEGDVHKINAAYFFGIPIRKVTKKIRDGVKAVIFGLIYQQGDKGLAKSTGRDEKEIHTIKGQFLDRFPVGLKWFDIIKNHAKKHYYVESPLGRRRTLWPLMFAKHFEASNDSSLRPYVGAIARCLRQAVNSPVQGFGSDFMMTAIRLMTGYMYDWYKEHGEYPDMSLNVSVHDSLTVEVDYKWFWLAINFIERAMTWGCKDFVEETYKFPVLSTPEIDFDIGGSESTVKKWDFSYEEMSKLIDATFEFQTKELNYKLDTDKMKKHIMEEQYHLMPEWMQKQLWANDIKIKRMGKNPLSKDDRANISQYKSELKSNAKLLKAAQKQDAEDEARDARLKEEAKAAAQRNKMRKAA